MKQKIVIKVQMNCHKCRSKALKIAAMAHGVSSVAIEGKDKDQVVVVGDGVDSASLTSLLRKKVGYASLVSVKEVKKEPDDKEKEKRPWTSSFYSQYPHYQMCKVVYDTSPSNCSIM